MHPSSLLRVEWFVNQYLADMQAPVRILDVGSYDVNGSYKPLFAGSRFNYTGLDMAKGPNVDIVPQRAYQWDEIASDQYDAIVSGQAFEHAEFFWITLAEMTRVLKPGGLMCIVAPRGFERHRYPVDCYRFDADGMVAMARYCNLTPLHASTNLAPPGAPSDWYCTEHADSLLIARKPTDWKGLLDVASYTFKEPDLDALATGFVSDPQAGRQRGSGKLLKKIRRALGLKKKD